MAHRNETINSRLLWKSAFLSALLVTVAACTTYAAFVGSPAVRESDGATASEPAPDADDAVYRVDTDDPVVFLTIDDGATRDPEMIEVLSDVGVEATLFLTDQYVRQDAGFFRRLRDETGAQIENHTLDHPDLTTMSAEEQRRQICKTSGNYEEEFGRRPTLLRPPYGSFNDDTLRAATECDVTHVVHWSAEISDGGIEFAASDRLQAGDIVLMHFSNQFRADVERFVEEAQQAGLEPALLENYLE